ncbi:DNA replication/repair protein RecF [Cerasicoccus arenae]|uniref:DNA replication and repair protein RecF n=1 Tax=Cerasicoccus arenae TaxID=424488 RepID=A0A8J3D8T1_9BACT|nr:DNA replication and repair protein RecF [Cerasicoccus arenae]MBK1856966.1 DNA replication/repair protein RecF [Cerasicoccus arenae]GHB90107.1 DNA replication and repair protein RecF [Cerasicoccus arenae]
MRLLRLHAENFRNIALTAVDISADSVFLLGDNGQGKSNLLEAAGLVTAVRSFRTTETRPLIRQGQAKGRVFFRLEHERRGETEITLTLASGTKQIEVDGESVSRLADFIGQFPSVVFSAEDIQLLRGSPGLRRRALDLTLAATDADYFTTLSRYHRALRDRNKLLKDGAPTANRRPFERLLATEAVKLIAARKIGVGRISASLIECYQQLCEVNEAPELQYKADATALDADAFLSLLEQQTRRDEALGSTQRGPHRDDLAFRLKGKSAREFASDGQQRGLVVAFRLAQLRYFQACSGIAPVVLADDVLGELDPSRRAGFWRAVGPDLQVIATGTEPPIGDARSWKVIYVKDGIFEDEAAAVR